MAELTLQLLDWQETVYGQQPKAQEVAAWLRANGIAFDGMPKVYASGLVQVEAAPELINIWRSFRPVPETVEDKLAGYVAEVTLARAELLAIPEHQRTPSDRLALATAALLMYGYGVMPND